MYYVEYEVEGFPGVHKAGPYSASEVDSQANDIKGFEGVHNLRIVSDVKKRRDVVVLGIDAALIHSIRSSAKEEKPVLPVQEKKAPIQTLAMMAAALGATIPFRTRSADKLCSRCQSPFNHRGAYCSKECYQASNSK